MELYLLRHGIAHNVQPGSFDAARELTPEGRQKTAAVAKAARKSGVRPSLILTSPYVRAHQTAETAAEELGYKGQLLQVDSLVPHGTPQAVWKDLRDYGGETAVLMAGHEPLLSQLTAFLLNTPSLRVDMKKSALVRIDLDSFGSVPHGTLRWMIIPALTL
jgi:phosphohistidine phosphatase